MRQALVRLANPLKWLGTVVLPLVCVQTGWTDNC